MKKEKIVITGGLGYIGTELCKLYSGESRYKDIVVTDNRFFSDRVKQLRDWGMSFVQASILEKEKMYEIIKDADKVIHLAGITDVAYTKTQANDEQDRLIIKNAIEGTNNVLDCMSSTCKIIFPSTHVVFEGLENTVMNVDEDMEACPVLTYSKCKYTNEVDIKNSGKNYVILRLASVYGISTDTMRIGIMPNLFSKMASQDQTIKLFSGGKQYKSLVSVFDVARCIKFMEASDITNEIFHLSKENTTVKEVAEICKKYNSNLKIVETDDEIPNLGYTLSNKKLLSTGFNFLYDLETCIKEMISQWSVKNIESELEYVIRGSKDYVDNRGKISNYELTEPVNMIGYIESKKGTVRANHYHPIQEQKCLLIKGRYISVIKDLSSKEAIIRTRIIKPGEIAVIKPNVAHTMVFLEDSVFLNLVRGEREHENYGITHTIPYELVDEWFKNELMQRYSHTCRGCGGKNLLPALQLGMSPLANNLLENEKDSEETFPLEMNYCEDCHNCQISYVVPPEKMFDNYLYVSSTAKSFRDHFQKAADKYEKDYELNKNSLVVDIGSNDGIGLRPFKEKGIKVVGVEPAANIAIKAIYEGIHTITSYFNEKVCEEIRESFGKADLVTASNVFAHSDELEKISNLVFSILKPNGTFIIEVQYLVNTIKDLTFDNVYHEHTNYWSVTSINNFFNRLGYSVCDIEHINTHGGSIRVYVKTRGSKINDSVKEFLQKELEFGINKYSTYKEFSSRVESCRKNVIENLKNLKSKNYKIVGYGAPAKATTALNYFSLDNSYIDYIVEDNSLKHNKIIPGVRIPIYSKDMINRDKPDIIIVMAWNFFEEIKKNNKDLVDSGIIFINIKDLQDRIIDEFKH